MQTDDKQYLSAADTAKLVRKALKAEFPGVKFSVRSKSYAGGASISVGWTDGPPTHLVDGVLGLYSGASFDGMIDLKSYHDSLLMNEDGSVQRVHFGADFVHSNRNISPEWYALIARMIEKASGMPCDLSQPRYDAKGRRSDGHNGAGWDTRYPCDVFEGRIVPFGGGRIEYGNTIAHRYVDKRWRVRAS